MAFPATSRRLADQLARVQQAALMVRGACISLRNRSAAEDVTAYAVTVDLLPRLRAAYGTFTEAETVPGLAAYAQAQLGSDDLDIAAEFTAMKAAIAGVVTWLRQNMPVADGYLAIETLNADGTLTPRSFPPAATGGLRTALQAVIDAVE